MLDFILKWKGLSPKSVFNPFPKKHFEFKKTLWSRVARIRKILVDHKYAQKDTEKQLSLYV